MARNLLIVLVNLFVTGLLVGIGAVVWAALNLPSPGLVVRHGFPPAGGPTG